MSRNWFVATTKQNAEETAAGGLIEQGYEIYVPLKYTRQTDGHRVVAKSSLRFDGYVIIAFDLAAEEHGPIGNTRGITSLLPHGDRPSALPDNWVPEMRAYETLEFFRAKSRKKPEPRKDLQPGDMVKIDAKDDPFFGQIGELMRVENYTAKVLLGMLIKEIPEIDLRKVEEEDQRAA